MTLQKKYIPETWDQIIGQAEIIASLSQYSSIGDLPHLLFAGTSGVGKTACAYVLAKELGVAIVELNASDERGIDTIREKVKTLLFTSGSRLILMDEADNLCLPKGTEVLKGYGTSKSIVPIEEIPQDRYVSMQSLNIETGEIEKDKGKCIDSGIVNFFKLSLVNGKELIASPNHPFFTMVNGKVKDIKVKDINVGDEILDYQNDLKIRNCEICEKFTVNKRFCSIECQDKGHSIDMFGSGNSMYGKEAWNKGKTIEDDIRIEKQGHPGDSNCSKRPDVKKKQSDSHKKYWTSLTENEKNTILKKSLEKVWTYNKNKTYDERFGERCDEERAKRSVYGIYGFLDSNYRRHLRGKDEIECECCHNIIKVGKQDGIYVHHEDGNHQNNNIENLMFVCPRCHNIIHNCKENFLEKGWAITHVKKEERFSEENVIDCPDLIKVTKIEYFDRERAYNITMNKNKNFFLGNGILTHNTIDAQAALRRPMEQALQRTNNRLILTVNRPWKIIDAISSRCTNFHFQPLSKKALTTIAYRVLKREGLKFTSKDEIKQVTTVLVVQSKGDARKLLDTIDNYSHSKESMIQYIQKRNAEVNQIKEIFNASVTGDWEECLMKLESWMIQQPTMDNTEVVEMFYAEVKELNIAPLHKFHIYQRLADTERALKLQTSPLVQISGFLASVTAITHYKGCEKND